MDLDAFALPLFKVEPRPWTVPDLAAFDGLLLTSANAVRHGGAGLDDLTALPVHAVGSATADRARAAGFNVTTVGQGGVDALLAALPSHLRLLHLGGEHRRAPEEAVQAITSITVYASEEIELPLGLDRIEGAVALVHSERAGRRLGELMPDKSRTGVAAISAVAARACGAGWAGLEVAARPDDEALLSLAARLCKEPQPE